LWGARTLTDFPQNNPMPQSAFCFIIGQRPCRIIEYTKYSRPIIQELLPQLPCFGMRRRGHCFTDLFQFCQQFLMMRRNRDGTAVWAFTGQINGMDKFVIPPITLR